MAEYEVVREVQNLCGNNQMRDVFFEEIETDDPVEMSIKNEMTHFKNLNRSAVRLLRQHFPSIL